MKAVAAMALNRVIGRAGGIPWHLPEDFRWFKTLTMGGILVMGSRTLLSLGRPLAGRGHVVLSRDPERLCGAVGDWALFWERARNAGWKVRLQPEWEGWGGVGDREIWLLQGGAEIIAAEAESARPVFLAGGAQIYEQWLGACGELFLSVVEREVEGDAVFPEFESRFEWVETVMRSEGFHVRRYQRRNP
jgi:dihydrofolate reductase